MKRINYFTQSVFLSFLLCVSIVTSSQNKYGQTMLFGTQGLVAAFTDTARPSVRKTAQVSMATYGFLKELSNICDSLTGKPLFYFNGRKIFDTMGNVMDNGDYLQDSTVYGINNVCVVSSTQGTLILPKGNNQYYAFATMVSDSMVQNCWFTPCPGQDHYDDLRFHVVDMNLNAGAGKVVVKNKRLLYHVPINIAQMMACRHANGKDWWLLKTGYDTNVIYSFRVTPDSIYGPQIQQCSFTFSSRSDHVGQIAFGKNGTKYAAVMGENNILMLADFDRCTGLLSQERYYNIPLDSTTILTNPSLLFDSVTAGVAFSTNGQFVYITRRFNVYQFEYGNEDSSQAWYRVKHGPDTILNQFEYYGQLANAPDGRIYVGKFGGGLTSNVIDHPNIKGPGCTWCNRCFRGDQSINWISHVSFANMPDYNLGPTNNPNCWPLDNSELVGNDKELAIYPNPASSDFKITYTSTVDGIFQLFNSLGNEVYKTELPKTSGSKIINIPSSIEPGMYYYKGIFDGGNVMGKLTIIR